MATPLQVLQGIAAAASIISSAKSILEDHDRINEQLDEVLSQLLSVKRDIARAVADILEAIDGLSRQIDENTAADNITLANRALYNDLLIFNDEQEAMGNSFEAADRLSREDNVTFASSFMYVVNIRLAVLKHYRPCYFGELQFQEEFERYLAKLRNWIAEVNGSINSIHTVDVHANLTIGKGPTGEPVVTLHYLEGRHFRAGVVVRVFRGSEGDFSDEAREKLTQQANGSRSTGIAADRQQFGVVAMEETAQAWEDAFSAALRQALSDEVLNRPVLAIDSDREGFMVDGRILPTNLEPRALLFEVLISREFRRRVEKSWRALIEDGDDRLAQYAFQRLFSRDVTKEEIQLIRDIAAKYSYAACIAMLLHSEEYEKRYGKGLPGAPAGEQPIFSALSSSDGETNGES